jgi:hypothetical protein
MGAAFDYPLSVHGRGLRDCAVADRRDRHCARAGHTRVRRAVRESGQPALAGATEGGFGSAAGQNACAWRGDVKEIPLKFVVPPARSLQIATKFGQRREASLSVHEPTSACLLDHLVGDS